MMLLLVFFLLLAGALLLTLFAYVDRLYTEMGKFYLLGVEDNLDVFERQVEPGLKLDRGRGGLTFALLMQMAILELAVVSSYVVFIHEPASGTIVQTVVLLVVAVVVLGHLIPHVLITRTTGKWLVPLRPVLRFFAVLAAPVVWVLSFSFSVATLGRQTTGGEQAPTPTEHFEALIERGEEEGLIEEDDRRLIQSAVQFGDKTVRETMTPRPNIVAVDKNITLEELLKTIESKHYSRVPVYDGDLDHIIGVVYTRELIHLNDQELKSLRASEHVRPLLFVPETKSAADLLREMQQQNIHMAIVIDEYGSVAGLATMEDLVEELVGEIHDETETQRDVIAEPDHSYVVSGHVDVDRLEEWFGSLPEVPADAATIAGLVNAVAGHVPQAGEIIEHGGLRFEILSANGLKVERLRIRKLPPQSHEVH